MWGSILGHQILFEICRGLRNVFSANNVLENNNLEFPQVRNLIEKSRKRSVNAQELKLPLIRLKVFYRI